MKLVIFYQYFSKKLKLKGVLIPDRPRSQSTVRNTTAFSMSLFLRLTVKYSSKVQRQDLGSCSSADCPMTRLFLRSSLISFMVFLQQFVQKSFSFMMLLSTINLWMISFSNSYFLRSSWLGSRPRIPDNSFQTIPNIAPFVLFKKALWSSYERIPEKSNLMLRVEMSLTIFDILKVFRSYACTREGRWWSKSCIMDCSIRTLTLNCSRALAKCSILFMFFIQSALSAMSSYFQLNFWMCLRSSLAESMLIDSYDDLLLRQSLNVSSRRECLTSIYLCMCLLSACVREVSLTQVRRRVGWGRGRRRCWRKRGGVRSESKRELR